MFATYEFVDLLASKNFSSALLSSRPFLLANIYAARSASLALRLTIGHWDNEPPELSFIGLSGTNALLL
jgi:hypothetical protein